MSNQQQPFKAIQKMKIVGVNFAVLMGYTIISCLVGGFILDAVCITVQVLFCIGNAIGNRNLWWLLSALMVLIVGFSTCVNFLGT